MFKGIISIVLVLIFAAAAVFLFAGGDILFNSMVEKMSAEKRMPDENSTVQPDLDALEPAVKQHDSPGKTADGTEHVQHSEVQVPDKEIQNQPAEGSSKNTAVPKEEEQDEKEQPEEETMPAIIPEQVQEKAEALAGRKVEVKDWIKVAEILVGKMSLSEIKFLFDSAKDNIFLNSSVEELKKIRKIIFSKLSAQDLEAIRTIGRKYNKDMKIIDPDISVEEEKQKALERAEKKR